MKTDLRGTWPQALKTFFIPLVIIAMIRWLILEPFVIPSGSMIPTLLIHDHIFVNKLAFGIRYPFSKKYMVRWGQPKVGEIIVFRYPKDPNVFFVKRVQAISGDRIRIENSNLYLNNQLIERTPTVAFEDLPDSQDFKYFQERNYTIRYKDADQGQFSETVVDDQSVFVIGDNRDQSSDSRFWGSIPMDYVIGRPMMIWLSCEEPFPGTEMLCDPQTLRFQRIGKILL